MQHSPHAGYPTWRPSRPFLSGAYPRRAFGDQNTSGFKSHAGTHGFTPQPPNPLTMWPTDTRFKARGFRNVSLHKPLPSRTPGKSSPHITDDPKHSLSHTGSRIALPFLFSDASIASRIHIFSHGRRGISLGEWARLAEKRKTYLGIDGPHECVGELFSDDTQILFQTYWPGYDPRTCYLELPAHIAQGESAFTKVDLLDMVCQSLVDWVTNMTNRRHIECREPQWAIGLKQITFKHIYITSIVEVKGYISKWVPVLEIDPQAFQSSCRL